MCEYKEDCIHLKACRRLQKIGRTKGHVFGRGCTEECTAYETEEDFINNCENCYSYEDVQTAINGATRDALSGYTDSIVSDYL